MISLPGFGLSLILSIALCVHVVRTHREMYWLWIILAFPFVGALIYFVAIVLPELTGGKTARVIGTAARDTLDPDRDYRRAKAAYQDSATVANAIRLGAAAAALGRHAEAEALYAGAAHGVHADDPTLLLGRAGALIELGRAAEALPILLALEQQPDGRTPQVCLALGRVHEALGQMTEAEKAYDHAAGRLPGMEALARYAAFLAHTGRQAQAREQLEEIDRRIRRADPYFRKEARAWRDLAARAIG
jgi:hypothetical protein